MAGKHEIVERVAARTADGGGTRTRASEAVEAVLAEITAALVAGERVTLTGFGTFEPVARPERSARNPRTGETVRVAATTVTRFRPGAGLRAAVAGHDAGTSATAGASGASPGGAPSSTAGAAGSPRAVAVVDTPATVGKQGKKERKAAAKAGTRADSALTTGKKAEVAKSGKKTDSAKTGKKAEVVKTGKKAEVAKSGKKTDSAKTGKKAEAVKSGTKAEAARAGKKPGSAKHGKKTGAAAKARAGSTTARATAAR
ncbi:HU family DNA-binding protein [Cellulomonas sp. NPDC057328]|uniref:HU family DNA-binding protein n=1 Tax=Cellulomonas sp. NPDC057328 TaxID=3346101 RepID=UPI00362A5954